MNFGSVNPIKALFWSAVLNGIAAVPIMITMMLMTSNRKVIGTLKLPRPQKIIGWIATSIMLLVAVGMLGSLVVNSQ
jgi:Mn2+/Fe2+ NRAMP family transporter